jgi:hypothetical protein
VILNKQGHLVAIVHIKAGGTGTVKLDPGHYSLRASPRPSSCGPQSATVTSGHTTQFTFWERCSYF